MLGIRDGWEEVKKRIMKPQKWIYQGNRWCFKRYFPHQLRSLVSDDDLCNGGHAPPPPPQLVSLVLDISAILFGVL